MKSLFICLLSLSPLFVASQTINVTRLQCQNANNPLGVEQPNPALSWQLTSNQRNTMQTAYRILVSDDVNLLKSNKGNIWDSGKINSQSSIQVKYTGQKLKSAKTYYWKVKVWDNKGRVSDWSDKASWQMGLLTAADWSKAQWIGYNRLPDSARIVPALHSLTKAGKNVRLKRDILPLLRKEFTVSTSVKSATLFICGLGQFELSLNGKKVSDHFLDPGWTQYDKHALYVTFDVTKILQHGKNALGVQLGNGFYYIPNERYTKITGAYGFPKMRCKLMIEYRNGAVETLVSDTSWRTHESPTVFSSIYGGEDYDARLEQSGWDKPGFNDRHWQQAVVVDGPPLLHSQTAEPVKLFDELKPQKITQPKPGLRVYDLGQNASGIPAISVKGKRGSVVKITPGELLNPDGTVNQSATGRPNYFSYILKGEGVESWQPKFTYYGFRYVQVEGAAPAQEHIDSLPVLYSVKGLHNHYDAHADGTFWCSDTLFNSTYKLIDWAIRSNMVSVLTDCPHREKLGWLEEAHLMGSSVRYAYNIASLGRKITHDMMNAQTGEGLVPDIAPEYVQFSGGFRDSPEWGSSAIILPWYLYHWYGDIENLKMAYPMMKRYIAYLDKKSENHILSYGLGDWFDIGPKRPGESQLTPKGVTATAIYYYDLDIIRQVAALLGEKQDAEQYGALAATVKKSFNEQFFDNKTAQYASGSQAANAMAVYMKLVELSYKNAVVANLVKDIRDRNNSLTAGDVGFRYVLRVLEDEGYPDVIYAMNSRSDVPGYGYQLAHGATALTESWQAYGFVSNNHLMLGHLMEWFYSGLGGIRQADGSIAFKTIEIRPQPVGSVTAAKASYSSPYGVIRTEWNKLPKGFNLTVEIPANATARIYLPANARQQVTESGKPVEKLTDIRIAERQENCLVLTVGSGKYQFLVN
ncbi:Bacterial alpha-L-rhamnosidase [Pedobacter sp. BS3]|uniref:family 78 glycoside hydrolase catalytic domain n=1 Tax=Pedobacter sp. BS3 TaxID=2567937 RepID=UPI0011EF6930|nr:family 78 glycoside hydrolase catalytic domain [Pedobacter sp. BS3]TZF83834.1 Bacterial alpha-L-rhamnosidase [Pedobacter sp. BS3]